VTGPRKDELTGISSDKTKYFLSEIFGWFFFLRTSRRGVAIENLFLFVYSFNSENESQLIFFSFTSFVKTNQISIKIKTNKQK
jgi:hypothetical protein